MSGLTAFDDFLLIAYAVVAALLVAGVIGYVRTRRLEAHPLPQPVAPSREDLRRLRAHYFAVAGVAVLGLMLVGAALV